MSLWEIILMVVGAIIILAILIPLCWPVLLGLIGLGIVGAIIYGIILLIGWLDSIQVFTTVQTYDFIKLTLSLFI